MNQKSEKMEEIAQSPQQKPKFSFGACLVSGGFAGLSTDVLLFPLDTLKTRLQVG